MEDLEAAYHNNIGVIQRLDSRSVHFQWIVAVTMRIKQAIEEANSR